LCSFGGLYLRRGGGNIGRNIGGRGYEMGLDKVM